MHGYWQNASETARTIKPDPNDPEGGPWLHTGDIGEIDERGRISITDRKKDLFKLSTGKYVMPQPIENRLGSQPLVDKAVVVGSDRKFCSALIFPSEDQVRVEARERDLDADASFKELLQQPEIVDAVRDLVVDANEGLDHWSTVKRFALVPDELTIEAGLLTPTLKVKRPEVQKTFAAEIDALYYDEAPPSEPTEKGAVVAEVASD